MRRLLVAVALTGLLVVACGGAAGQLEASDAWSRPVPPAATAAPIFFVVTNDTDSARTLVRATSGACARVEIHETVMVDDVMSMQPRPEGVTVSAGDSARFEPGGLHLMCLEPDISGASFVTVLTFDDSTAIDVEVAVDDR